MKVKSSSTGGLPWAIGGLGAVGTCLALGPVGILAFPLLFLAAKKDVKEVVDKTAVRDVPQIVDTWQRNRKPGESSISVERTVDIGRFFSVPMTRKYTFTLDDDEV